MAWRGGARRAPGQQRLVSGKKPTPGQQRSAPGRGRGAVVLAGLVLLLAACRGNTTAGSQPPGGPTPPASAPPSTSGPPSTVAPTTVAPAGAGTGPAAAAPVGTAPPHVMVLMMENESYSDIVGAPDAPYETALSKRYETATDYYGVGHNSLDDYLALLTGRFYTWSTGDCSPGSDCQSFDPTLPGQMDAAHIPWAAYMGSMPTNCDQRDHDQGTPTASYAVRHDPFVYFPNLVAADCNRVQPESAMLPQLNSSAPPDFVWVTPSICEDAGRDADCSTVATGDAYLAREIPAIQATRWYAQGGVIVLSYDEGDASGQGEGEYIHGAGNHVLTVVVSAATQGGSAHRDYANHFGLLAGIEQAYGLTCLAAACVPANGLLSLPGS